MGDSNENKILLDEGFMSSFYNLIKSFILESAFMMIRLFNSCKVLLKKLGFFLLESNISINGSKYFKIIFAMSK